MVVPVGGALPRVTVRRKARIHEFLYTSFKVGAQLEAIRPPQGRTWLRLEPGLSWSPATIVPYACAIDAVSRNVKGSRR